MMDGWMDGWLDEWVGGWSLVDLVVVRCLHGWLDSARTWCKVSLQGIKCGGSTCFNQGRKEGEVIKGDWQLDPQMNQTNFATIILFTFMFTMRNLFCDCLLLDVPCVTLLIVAQCLFPFHYFVRLHASS
jgi:hypothetical protein